MTLIPSRSWAAATFNAFCVSVQITSPATCTLTASGSLTKASVIVFVGSTKSGGGSYATVSAGNPTVDGNAATVVSGLTVESGSLDTRADGYGIYVGSYSGGKTVSVAFTGAPDLMASLAVLVENTDSSTPIINGVNEAPGFGAGMSLATTNPSGNLAVDFAFDRTSTLIDGEGANQTQIAASGGGGDTGYASSYSATVNNTMTWAGAGWAVHNAVSFKASAGGGGATCAGRLTLLGVGGC